MTLVQIAVVCTSSTINKVDLAFLVEAWSAQSIEFCAAWGISPYIPVVLYDTIPTEQVGTGELRVMTIEDDIDTPNALGFHTDEAGIVFARILAEDNADSGSHECCEETLDPTVDEWVPIGDGRETAKESCDAVESDNYPQAATIGGDTRQIPVSNYLLPSWFDPNGKAPFDRMGKLIAPFTLSPGGYMVVQDAAGNDTDIFADKRRRRIVVGGPAAHARLAAKLARPESRLMRRLQGK